MTVDIRFTKVCVIKTKIVKAIVTLSGAIFLIFVIPDSLEWMNKRLKTFTRHIFAKNQQQLKFLLW